MINCPNCGAKIKKVDVHFEAWREIDLTENDQLDGDKLDAECSLFGNPDYYPEIVGYEAYCRECKKTIVLSVTLGREDYDQIRVYADGYGGASIHGDGHDEMECADEFDATALAQMLYDGNAQWDDEIIEDDETIQA